MDSLVTIEKVPMPINLSDSFMGIDTVIAGGYTLTTGKIDAGRVFGWEKPSFWSRRRN